eukprot:6472690-Amphidinium_carterae.1
MCGRRQAHNVVLVWEQSWNARPSLVVCLLDLQDSTSLSLLTLVALLHMPLVAKVDLHRAIALPHCRVHVVSQAAKVTAARAIWT